jgi:hypothetical protein
LRNAANDALSCDAGCAGANAALKYATFESVAAQKSPVAGAFTGAAGLTPAAVSAGGVAGTTRRPRPAVTGALGAGALGAGAAAEEAGVRLAAVVLEACCLDWRRGDGADVFAGVFAGSCELREEPARVLPDDGAATGGGVAARLVPVGPFVGTAGPAGCTGTGAATDVRSRAAEAPLPLTAAECWGGGGGGSGWACATCPAPPTGAAGGTAACSGTASPSTN